MKFFFEKGKNKEKPKYEKILPSDVRYALQYKEALLNKDEIEQLNENHFETEAFYMTIKGLQENPEVQKELLGKYIKHELSNKDNEEESKIELRNLLKEYIKELGESSVKGGKLAQLSRQGFDFWQDRFKSKAEELSKDKRNVFLVANAMMLGLSHFIREFKKENKSFNIIIPDWLKQGAHTIGYSIDFEDKENIIDFLKRSDDKNEALAVLVDDATNSGSVFNKIKEYWKKNGFKKPDTIAISNLSNKT
jgi:hypothetical protein